MSARLDGVNGDMAGLKEGIRQKQQQLDTFETRKASIDQQVRMPMPGLVKSSTTFRLVVCVLPARTAACCMFCTLKVAGIFMWSHLSCDTAVTQTMYCQRVCHQEARFVESADSGVQCETR